MRRLFMSASRDRRHSVVVSQKSLQDPFLAVHLKVGFSD